MSNQSNQTDSLGYLENTKSRTQRTRQRILWFSVVLFIVLSVVYAAFIIYLLSNPASFDQWEESVTIISIIVAGFGLLWQVSRFGLVTAVAYSSRIGQLEDIALCIRLSREATTDFPGAVAAVKELQRAYMAELLKLGLPRRRIRAAAEAADGDSDERAAPDRDARA